MTKNQLDADKDVRGSGRYRLFESLKGHVHQLWAEFYRSAAHKLPGAKGILREDALARFIGTWTPKRYSVLTNVFAAHHVAGEFGHELDLVIHDGFSGAQWPLDAYYANSVVTWDEVALVVQVKSTLNEANFTTAKNEMVELDGYCAKTGRSGHRNECNEHCNDIPPLKVLFAYKIEEKFIASFESAMHSQDSGFDVVIVLERGAYFRTRDMQVDNLRKGIPNGLTPRLTESDVKSINETLMEDVARESQGDRFPRHKLLMSENVPEYALLGLAALATYATSGEIVLRTLLSAMTKVQFSSFYDEHPYEEIDKDIPDQSSSAGHANTNDTADLDAAIADLIKWLDEVENPSTDADADGSDSAPDGDPNLDVER